MIKNYLKLMRPHQWSKNSFLFLPLFFNQHLTDSDKFLSCLFAFIGFSCMASAVYCLNDVIDAPADRLHPEKKHRPVANGKISIRQAVFLMLFLILSGIVFFRIGKIPGPALYIAFTYILINIAYTLWLKKYAIIDVFIIAAGFVLRIIIGGIAADTTLSPWIILMTFLLALFLSFAKRRDDVRIYENTGIKSRKNILRYNTDFLDSVLVITATITILAYIMYTVTGEVTERFGSKYIYLTSLFVIAGIFRYLQLTFVDLKSGNPTKILLKDPFIQLCIAGWLSLFAVIIYLK